MLLLFPHFQTKKPFPLEKYLAADFTINGRTASKVKEKLSPMSERSVGEHIVRDVPFWATALWECGQSHPCYSRVGGRASPRSRNEHASNPRLSPNYRRPLTIMQLSWMIFKGHSKSGYPHQIHCSRQKSHTNLIDFFSSSCTEDNSWLVVLRSWSILKFLSCKILLSASSTRAFLSRSKQKLLSLRISILSSWFLPSDLRNLLSNSFFASSV